MKTYGNSQQFIERALRRFTYGFLIFFILILGGTIAGAIAINADRGIQLDVGSTIANLGGLVVGLAMAAFAISRRTKGIRKELERPLLEFGDDKIARPASLYPRVEISRSEVTVIQETAGGLCVIADNPRRAVLVPNKMEPADYQSIRAALAEWMPFTAPSTKSKWFVWAYIAAMVLGVGLLCFSWSLWVVIPISIAFVGLFGYTLWYIRGSIKTSPRMFFTFIFGLLIILALIAGKIWLTIAMINGGF